ncbi:MAG: RNA polymerase sporulation sigma factor SigH [Armatimonadota bacterium]|nr:RNA polymerase sporulation sigma factor SigH [bacterium]
MTPTGLFEAASSSRLSRLADEQVAEFARAGSPQATEYLLRKYKGFVEGKARSYFLAGAEPEDVVQEGMIGLFKAIRDFEAGKLAHFRSFAELCVTRQIITAVKSATRYKHSLLSESVSLDASCDDDGGGCLLDIIADSKVADPERVLIERRAKQYMQGHALDGLSKLEQEVLRGYLEGRSYFEMARFLHRSLKTIDNALQRAKRKVGRRLRDMN